MTTSDGAGSADCRGWLIEVFVNDDIYRLHADPARRLQAGLLQAKTTLASRTSYPTLPAPAGCRRARKRSDGSAPQGDRK